MTFNLNAKNDVVIRHDPNAKVVTIKSDNNKCKYFSLENPDRFVLDFLNTKEIEVTAADLKKVNARFFKNRLVIPVKKISVKDRSGICDVLITYKEMSKNVKSFQEIQKKDTTINSKFIEKKTLPNTSLNTANQHIVHTDPKNTSVNKKSIDNRKINKRLGKKTKSEFIITIDPGHGGRDPGTSFDMIKEKDLTLKIAKVVKKELEKDGYKVFLTRDKDVYISLEKRVAIAQAKKSSLFISIHIDQSFDTRAQGSTVYMISNKFWKDKHKAFNIVKKQDFLPHDLFNKYDKNAGFLLMMFMRDYSDSLSYKISYSIQKNFKNTGVCNVCKSKIAEFVVLNGIGIPSVLIEAGYISNSKDREKMLTSTFANNFANGIVKSVDEVFFGCIYG